MRALGQKWKCCLRTDTVLSRRYCKLYAVRFVPGICMMICNMAIEKYRLAKLVAARPGCLSLSTHRPIASFELLRDPSSAVIAVIITRFTINRALWTSKELLAQRVGSLRCDRACLREKQYCWREPRAITMDEGALDARFPRDEAVTDKVLNRLTEGAHANGKSRAWLVLLHTICRCRCTVVPSSKTTQLHHHTHLHLWRDRVAAGFQCTWFALLLVRLNSTVDMIACMRCFDADMICIAISQTPRLTFSCWADGAI